MDASLKIAITIKKVARDMRTFAAPSPLNRSYFKITAPRKGKNLNNKPANKRRDCLSFVILLLKASGCGTMKGIGKGMSDRGMMLFRLQNLFGDTFAPGGEYYLDPDIAKLISSMIRCARAKSAHAVPKVVTRAVPEVVTRAVPMVVMRAAPMVSIATLFTHTTYDHVTNKAELDRLASEFFTPTDRPTDIVSCLGPMVSIAALFTRTARGVKVNDDELQRLARIHRSFTMWGIKEKLPVAELAEKLSVAELAKMLPVAELAEKLPVAELAKKLPVTETPESDEVEVSLAALFPRSANLRTYRVDFNELTRLGCSWEMLARMFKASRACDPLGDIIDV
jgi:hypothetical protein